MHLEILTQKQQELIPLIKQFSDKFYLVGGTAIALQLGHRRSIDFDLFSVDDFKNEPIIKKISRCFPITHTFIKSHSELTILVNKVKMTFYQYQFSIPCKAKWEKVIVMPDVLTIAAMKAYALGQRAKWKDYVDLYFVLKQYSLKEIVLRAKKLFAGNFNERLLREQLDYFVDVNYAEGIKYMPGMAVSDKEIKKTLKAIALS